MILDIIGNEKDRLIAVGFFVLLTLTPPLLPTLPPRLPPRLTHTCKRFQENVQISLGGGDFEKFSNPHPSQTQKTFHNILRKSQLLFWKKKKKDWTKSEETARMGSDNERKILFLFPPLK